MAKFDFRGVIAPLVSTFTADDEFDPVLYRKQVKEVLKAGVHGLSPSGSTGEGAMVEDEDLVQMIKIIKEEAGDKIPCVAGVIRPSTRFAVRTALAAKEAGADALMVTPTFYNPLVPDLNGNYAFYKTLSDKVGLPIIIYNVVPQNVITVEDYTKISQIENVIGIKQSNGGIWGFYDQKLANGDKGLVYSAQDEFLYSTFALGADGAICAIISAFPEESVAMWDLTLEGKYDEAKKIQDKIWPVWKAVQGPQFPRRLKTALRLLGKDYGYCRSPLTPATEEEIAKMKVAIDAYLANK